MNVSGEPLELFYLRFYFGIKLHKSSAININNRRRHKTNIHFSKING